MPEDPELVLTLPPSADNPRNSEGDFIQLKDGKILFIYSHFTGGDGDYAPAYLAGVHSTDRGRTWSDHPVEILPNEAGLNTMSVSLLRLQNEAIALFYARKNSHTDCRPLCRISQDEALNWSEPVDCITDREGYFVLNNDRVIQMRNGRLILPVSLHEAPDMKWSNGGIINTYFSDDSGFSWQSGQIVENPDGVILQEPGTVELKDGRLLMFMRTDAGVQYISYSMDGGENWSPAHASGIVSPLSPASIERIPSTNDLVLVWNNNDGQIAQIAGKRTPLSIAISDDDGKTWTSQRTLADNPNGWYCYTAIDFIDDYVILGYCAGDRTKNNGLAETHISRLSLDWIYNGHIN